MPDRPVPILPALPALGDPSVDAARAHIAGWIDFMIQDDPPGWGDALDILADRVSALTTGATRFGPWVQRAVRWSPDAMTALVLAAGACMLAAGASHAVTVASATRAGVLPAARAIGAARILCAGGTVTEEEVCDAIADLSPRDLAAVVFYTGQVLAFIRIEPQDLRSWAAVALLAELGLDTA